MCFPLFLDTAVQYFGASFLNLRTFQKKKYDNRHARGVYSKGFLIIINKLHITWTGMVKGKFKPRNADSGYAIELEYLVTGNRSSGYPGTVKSHSSSAQSPLSQVSGFTVSGIIWEDLMPVLNHTVSNMRGLLNEMFRVKEEHPMMAKFEGYNSLAELIYHV